MKKYRFSLLAVLLGVVLVSCRDAQPVRIKMVCTTDVHGNYFPHDFLADEPLSGSLAHVASYLNELRSPEAYGGNVIYMDNGDILHGQPAAFYYNTAAIQPTHLAAEALNYMGCEVAVLGNHEIETGGPTYYRYIQDLECPVLGGNIFFEGSEVAFLPPYTMVERDGIRIAVLGLTTPAIPDRYPRAVWRGLEFRDMESSVKQWMEHVKEQEQPDLIVGLFHSGLKGGIAHNGYVENATRAIAENVPGFDAIFYGHVHREACDKVVNVEGDTVLLINPASRARKVAALDIQVVKGEEPVLAAEIVDMSTYDPDTAYVAHFRPHAERVQAYLDKRVGAFSHALDARKAYFGPSAYMDYIHGLQLDITKAEISLASPLNYDMVIPEGDVLVRHLFDICPYETMLNVMMLTGQEVKDYLEYSYAQWVGGMTSAKDHLLRFDEASLAEGKPRLAQSCHDFDSAAGIIYEVDVTKPAGSRVIVKAMADGKPFELKREYRVVVNSHRGIGHGGFLTEGAGIAKEKLEGRIILSTEVGTRFYMLNHMEMAGVIEPASLDNWKFVPERWTRAASERDYQLLFK